MEAVVQSRYTKAHDDTAEDAHLQGLDAAHGGDGSFQHIRGNGSIGQNLTVDLQHGVDGSIHNEEGNQRGKGGYFFLFVGHTDGYAHGEDQRQVIEHGAAHLIHDN